MFRTILKHKSKTNKGIEREKDSERKKNREREGPGLEWETEQEGVFIERKQQPSNDRILRDSRREWERDRDRGQSEVLSREKEEKWKYTQREW